jgi:hypothetical protein
MIFKRGEKLYTIPESDMVDALMKEIDIWEEEERSAGRLKAGAPSFKVDAREEEHHDDCCEDDANGRVKLPLLK